MATGTHPFRRSTVSTLGWLFSDADLNVVVVELVEPLFVVFDFASWSVVDDDDDDGGGGGGGGGDVVPSIGFTSGPCSIGGLVMVS